MALSNEADKTTSALDVAGMILLAAQERGLGGLTARKLQKLLYFSQLYHLGLNRAPAFHENLKAWEDGPVVPDVWVKFKTGRPPEAAITLADFGDLNALRQVIAKKPSIYEDVVKVILDFGHFDQQELVDLTHGQEPWLEAVKKGPRDSVPLNITIMKKFATVLLRHTRPNEMPGSLEIRITQLHATTGDLNFIRAKVNLADTAGQLDACLALGFDTEKTLHLRSALAEAVRRFMQSYDAKAALNIDPNNSDEVDQFARALTDFGMVHRPR